MTRKLPPFAAVRAFEAAARLGSIKKASEELHLTASAISHQIRALEDYLDQDTIAEIDFIDQVQLKTVIDTCKSSRSAADASRKLFNVSRTKKTTQNDSHRLGVLLKKYHLSFNDIVDS